MLLAAVAPREAAGAFAVGACGAYGYGYDYKQMAAARTRRGARVHGQRLQDRRRSSAAAVRRSRSMPSIPCGSYGWAINAHLGQAENTSMRRCYQYGGHDCVVRAWACDEKG